MLRRKLIEAHGGFALFYLSIHFHQEQVYSCLPYKMDCNMPMIVQSLYSPTDRQNKINNNNNTCQSNDNINNY